MVLEKMIDKREDNLEIEEYIERAMAAGVKIQNHGDNMHFKHKVDSFKELMDDYINHQNEQKEEVLVHTNLKLDATIGISRAKKSQSITKMNKTGSPRKIGNMSPKIGSKN